jgi:hypothetical protein
MVVSCRVSLLLVYSESGIGGSSHITPIINLVIPLDTHQESYSRSTTCDAQLFTAYSVITGQLPRGVRGINPVRMTLG